MSQQPPYMRGKVPLIASLGLAAVLIALGVRFTFAPAGGETPVADTASTNTGSSAREQHVDTDGDGMPDWMELLAGSDPRDPESTAQEISTTSSGMLAADAGTTSATDAVTSEIFTNYVSAQQSLRTDYEDIGAGIAERLQIPDTFEPYAAADISVVADTSTERVERYRSDMQDALSPLLDLTEPEIATYARAVETRSDADKEAFDALRTTYRDTLARTRAVTVPETALDAHLRATNALAYFSHTLEQLNTYLNDPIASMALFSAFNESEQRLQDAFNNLGSYYRDTLAYDTD